MKKFMEELERKNNELKALLYPEYFEGIMSDELKEDTRSDEEIVKEQAHEEYMTRLL